MDAGELEVYVQTTEEGLQAETSEDLLYHTRETLSVGSYGAQGAILEAGGIERRNNMGVLKAIGLMVVFISVAVVVTFVLIEIVGVNREICRYIGMVLGIGGGVAAASISINRDWI